jgi:hypothetical protein
VIGSLLLAATLLSSPAPAYQTPFNDYIEVAIDCGESMRNKSIDGVVACSLELDKIVPMECYALSWSYIRVATEMIVVEIETGRTDFNPAIRYLVDEFVGQAKETGEACSPYILPDDVS